MSWVLHIFLTFFFLSSFVSIFILFLGECCCCYLFCIELDLFFWIIVFIIIFIDVLHCLVVLEDELTSSVISWCQHLTSISLLMKLLGSSQEFNPLILSLFEFLQILKKMRLLRHLYGRYLVSYPRMFCYFYPFSPILRFFLQQPFQQIVKIRWKILNFWRACCVS